MQVTEKRAHLHLFAFTFIYISMKYRLVSMPQQNTHVNIAFFK